MLGEALTGFDGLGKWTVKGGRESPVNKCSVVTVLLTSPQS